MVETMPRISTSSVTSGWAWDPGTACCRFVFLLIRSSKLLVPKRLAHTGWQ